MTQVYLGLGTNQGDRWEQLREAVRRLAGCVDVRRLSSVYESEPAYVADQPHFLNMALEATTRLDPHALLACLKAIEAQMGRQTGPRNGPRPIDIDILLFGDLRLDGPDLQIPHPRLHERPFVLQPLAELAPRLVPPGHDTAVEALAQRAPPIGEVIARLGPLDESR